MELFEDQLLQLVGCLALLGVDAGLGEQPPRVDFSLGEQQSQADVLGLQEVLRRRRQRARVVAVRMKHGHH
jgi:hypothetical protein